MWCIVVRCGVMRSFWFTRTGCEGMTWCFCFEGGGASKDL